MKTSVPYPSKTTIQVAYVPQLDLYDYLFNAASKVPVFRDWETDRLSVTLKDWKNRCSLRIAHNGITYDQDVLDENQEVLRADKIFVDLLHALHVGHLTRIGYRRRQITGVPIPFADLSQIVQVKLYSQDRGLRLPGKVQYILYSVNTSDDNFDYQIQAAPIWRQQAEEAFQFNRAHHLQPAQPEQDYIGIVSKYPETGFLIDVDVSKQAHDPYLLKESPYFREGDLHIDTIVETIEQARAQFHRTSSSLLNYVFASELQGGTA